MLNCDNYLTSEWFNWLTINHDISLMGVLHIINAIVPVILCFLPFLAPLPPPLFPSSFFLLPSPPSLLIPGAVLHTDLPAAAGPAGRDCGHKREIENHAAHAVIRSYQEKHWSEKSRNADQSIWGEKLKPHHNLREGKDYHRQSFYLRLIKCVDC